MKQFSINSFIEYTKKRESLLYPIHALQVKLKGVMFGDVYWYNLTEARKKNPEYNVEGKFVFELRNKLTNMKLKEKLEIDLEIRKNAIEENIQELHNKRKTGTATGPTNRMTQVLGSFQLVSQKKSKREVILGNDSKIDENGQIIPLKMRQHRSNSIFIPKVT